MNYILRDIKLSKLTDTPMSDNASKLIKFWNDLWCDMKVSIDTEKGEIKCWKEGYDYYYFRQDNKNDNLWCEFGKIWTFFRDDLCLKYGDTQELIQYMVGETLNSRINTPKCLYGMKREEVGETLNCRVNTPIISSSRRNSRWTRP